MEKTINKIKEIVSKYDNIFVLFGITLILSTYCFYYNFLVTDELWNIGNLYKIYNGGKIYNECNIIVTPLFFYIGLLFFKVLGANYFVFRFYNFLILVSVAFNIYLLLKEMKLNKRSSCIIVLILSIIINLLKEGTIYSSAGYNFLAVALYIWGIRLKLKYEDKKINNFLQGIMMFLIFYTKQNVGVFYICASAVIDLIKDRKKAKNIIIQILICAILTILSLVQMHFYGNLQQFINYTVLGLKEFESANTQYIALPGVILIVSFTFYIRNVLNKNKILTNKEKNKFNCVLIYSLFLLLIMYPIIDLHHLVKSGVLIVSLDLYAYCKIIEKQVDTKNEKIVNTIILIILIFYLIKSCINNIEYYKYFEKTDNIYYGAILEDSQKENIETICKYIKQKQEEGIEVKVLSNMAMKYAIQLKINNEEFDLPFKGNLGKEGEEGLLNKIINLENAEILIVKDEDKICYQESMKIKDYITENFEKIGEIEEFYIYEIPIYEER